MGVFIGADGGASKLMLCLSAGGTRRFSKVPQCVNPVVCGQGVSADIIIGSMLGFCEREGVSPASVDGVFAGIAGATERDYTTMLKTRLQKTFPAADYVGNDRYVFNIGGNKFRTVAVVVFFAGDMHLRFVGTHAEYDRIKDIKSI